MNKEIKMLIIIIIIIILSIITMCISTFNNKKIASEKCDCYGNLEKENLLKFKGEIKQIINNGNHRILLIESKEYKVRLMIDNNTIIKNNRNFEEVTLDDLKVGEKIEALPEKQTNLLYPSYVKCIELYIVDEYNIDKKS